VCWPSLSSAAPAAAAASYLNLCLPHFTIVVIVVVATAVIVERNMEKGMEIDFSFCCCYRRRTLFSADPSVDTLT